jgi:hypothetical protein
MYASAQISLRSKMKSIWAADNSKKMSRMAMSQAADFTDAADSICHGAVRLFRLPHRLFDAFQ